MQVLIAILLLVAAVTVIIIILIQSQKKKNRAALKKHEEQIEQILTESSISADYRKQLIFQNLFIDLKKRKLLLIDHREAKYKYDILKLDDIKSCKFKQFSDSIIMPDQRMPEVITRQMGVEVTSNNKSDDLPLIVFYDVNRHNIYMKSDKENDANVMVERIMAAVKKLQSI